MIQEVSLELLVTSLKNIWDFQKQKMVKFLHHKQFTIKTILQEFQVISTLVVLKQAQQQDYLQQQVVQTGLYREQETLVLMHKGLLFQVLGLKHIPWRVVKTTLQLVDMVHHLVMLSVHMITLPIKQSIQLTS